MTCLYKFISLTDDDDKFDVTLVDPKTMLNYSNPLCKSFRRICDIVDQS